MKNKYIFQNGFVPLLVLPLVLAIIFAGGLVTYISLPKEKQQEIISFLVKHDIKNEEIEVLDDLNTSSPQLFMTPTPAPQNIVNIPSATVQATTPPLRSISVGGYAFEDRTDDGIYNSDDPKLPNMQFYLYDSFNSQWVSTIYTDANGNFSHSLSVRGNLIVRPSGTNNFVAKTSEKTISTSTNNLGFRFRSASAPVPMQNIGILEGNVYQDANRNLTRDAGEMGVRFYKLYLKDSVGNYFNTVEGGQTTDEGGHFKFLNLPVPADYIFVLSNPTGEFEILMPQYNISLSVTNFQNTSIEIPVYKY